jgi:hypothetical protein
MPRGIDGIVEDDEVAAADFAVGGEDAGRDFAADLLIGEQEVADEEGRLHGERRDAEGLHGEGGDEERDNDDVEQGLEGLEEAVLGLGWNAASAGSVVARLHGGRARGCDARGGI